MKISIIIPLYNKESSIKQTVLSVLNQRHPDFELVVVDDGSTDSSMSVLKTITDSRMVIDTQPNCGPGAARNKGVSLSKGEWILFLDADDQLKSDALSVYSALATSHPQCDIIDCGQEIITQQGTTQMPHTLEGISKNPMRDFFFRRISPGANHSLFRREFILKYPYDTRLRRFEDAEVLCRMLQTAKVYSSRSVVSSVQTEFSSASSVRKNIDEDFLGHLSMKGKDFWYKMCIYRTFLEERNNYPTDCHRLYPSWYHRYDLLLIFKLLGWYAKYFKQS